MSGDQGRGSNQDNLDQNAGDAASDSPDILYRPLRTPGDLFGRYLLPLRPPLANAPVRPPLTNATFQTPRVNPVPLGNPWSNIFGGGSVNPTPMGQIWDQPINNAPVVGTAGPNVAVNPAQGQIATPPVAVNPVGQYGAGNGALPIVRPVAHTYPRLPVARPAYVARPAFNPPAARPAFLPGIKRPILPNPAAGAVAPLTNGMDIASILNRLLDIFPDADEKVLRDRISRRLDAYPPGMTITLNPEQVVDEIVDDYIEMKGKYPKRRKLDGSAPGCSSWVVGDSSGGSASCSGAGDDAGASRFDNDPDEPSLDPYRGFIRGYDRFAALDVLGQFFLGFYKNEFQRIAVDFNYSVATVVLLIGKILAAEYPELYRAMLRGNPGQNHDHVMQAKYPRVLIYYKLSSGQVPSRRTCDRPGHVLVTLKVMRVWRRLSFPPARFIAEVDAIKDWLTWLDGKLGAAPAVDGSGAATSASTSGPTGSEAKKVDGVDDDDEDDDEDSKGNAECQCCFTEFGFAKLVQCFEGHLFCKECMKGFAQSAISGQGKAVLLCMAGDCEAGYPRAQLETCLDDKTLRALDEREQEESVRLALSSEEVSQCPHCTFKIILPPGDKVLKCQNPQCMKETCIVCKEDWEEHFGIPCSELETKDEEKLRTKAEERMTAARLRLCHKCKAPLVKDGGCNKMTCRCGGKMCYICRVPIRDYSHFCDHPRDPGKKCKKCHKCSLWTDPKKDDDRAIEEIRKDAEKEKEEKGYVNDRKIGPKQK